MQNNNISRERVMVVLTFSSVMLLLAVLIVTPKPQYTVYYEPYNAPPTYHNAQAYYQYFKNYQGN